MAAPLKPASYYRPTWPTPRELALDAADERLAAAKAAMTAAALSFLRGEIDAAAKTKAALTMVDEARSVLATLSDAEVDALANAQYNSRRPAT